MKIKQKSLELSQEWYWINKFECSFKELYVYFRLEEELVSFTRFLEWVIFPHLIRVDLLDSLYIQTRNRQQSSFFNSVIEQDLTTTNAEQEYMDYTNELTYIKYFHSIISTKHLHHIYSMKKNTSEAFFNSLVNEGYAKEEDILPIRRFFHERGEADTL